MFNFFNKPEYKMPEPVPYIEPQQPDPTTYYSIGLTDDNRVTFKIGYSTLTMNRRGVENLIEQFEVFIKNLPEEQQDEQS